MDEQTVPQFSPVEPPPQESTSVLSRYFNVLASPGEAFNGVGTLESKTSLWLVPMIILILITMGIAALTMSNPAIQQEMKEKVSQKMQKNVQDGKMTQEQADKYADVGGGWGKIMAIVGPIFGVPFFWLFMTLLYWVILAFIIGGEISWINAFTVVALGSAVYLIQAVITGLLVYATGSFTTQINLGFLVSGDTNATLHALFSRIDPFSFWQMWVLCIGFSKVSDLTLKKAAYGVVGLWLVWSAILVSTANVEFMKSFSGM